MRFPALLRGNRVAAALLVAASAAAAAAGNAVPDRRPAVSSAAGGATGIGEAAEPVRPAVATAVARLRATPEPQRLLQLRQLAPPLPSQLLAAEVAEVVDALPKGSRLDALNAVLPAVPARLEAADLGRLVAALPDRDRPSALRLLVLRAERLGAEEAATLLGPLRDQQRLDGLNAVLPRLPSGMEAGEAAPLLGPEGAPGPRVAMLMALVPRLAPSAGEAAAGLLDGLRDADRANVLAFLAQRIARPLTPDAALRLLDGVEAAGPRLQAVRSVAPLLGRVAAADAAGMLGPLRDDTRLSGLVSLADRLETPVDGAALGPLLGDAAGPARLRGLQALAPRLVLTPAQAADQLRGLDGPQRTAALPLVLERTAGDADPATLAELVRGLDPARAGRQAATIVRASVAEPGRLAPVLAALPPEARQSFLEQLAAVRDAPRLLPADARAALEAQAEGQRAGFGRPLLALVGPGATAADLGALLDALPPEQRAAASALRQWPPMGLAERAALLARFPAGWSRDDIARRLPEWRPAEARAASPGRFAVPGCEGLVAFGERMAEPAVAGPGGTPSATGGVLASDLPEAVFGTPPPAWSAEQLSAIAAAAAACRRGLAGLRDAARFGATLGRLEAPLARQVAFLRERDATRREMGEDPRRLAALPEGDALLDAADAALGRLDRWGGALAPEERRRHEEALRPGVERAAALLRRRTEAETAGLPATIDGLERLGAAYDRVIGPRAALEARADLARRFIERVEALAGPALAVFEAVLGRLPASGDGLARAVEQIARPGGAPAEQVPDGTLDRFRAAAARRAAAIGTSMKAAACGEALARAGLGARDRARPVLVDEGTAPLGEWLCTLRGQGLALARYEAPGLFGGAHALVFDLGGGVPLRLFLREAENAQRVRGLAATAAGDGTAEKPVALAAWFAAARDPAALSGLGGAAGYRPRRPPEPGSLAEALCPAHDRALAAARALDGRLGTEAGPDRLAEPFLREVVEPFAEALGGALREVKGRLAEVDHVAAAGGGEARSGPRPDAAALMMARGMANLFGGNAPLVNTFAADCGAKLRVPFIVERQGGAAAAMPQDGLAVPGAVVAGKRLWVWGSGEIASREQWRQQVEAQILVPLRVAAALPAPAPAQQRQAGIAERACLDFLARLHGPAGRPLLLLKATETFPAEP